LHQACPTGFGLVKSRVQSHKGTKPAMKKQPDTYLSSQFLGL
jgi:hypothetical protein